MAGAGTFTRFSQLPPELQDLVWQHAALLDRRPLAYRAQMYLKGVKIEVDRRDVSSMRRPYKYHLSMRRSAVASQQNTDFESSLALFFHPLMFTCRASRKVASHFLLSRPLLEPMTLEESELVTATGAASEQDQENEGGEGSILPPIKIDASADLVILDQGWNEVVHRATYSVAHAQRMQKSDKPLYLAAHGSWRNSDFGHCNVRSRILASCFQKFHHLKAFFLLVEPQELEQPVALDEEGSRALETLQAFPPRVDDENNIERLFYRGSYVYYTIPSEQLSTLGSLKPLIMTVNEVKETRMGYKWLNDRNWREKPREELKADPVRIQFMSWRKNDLFDGGKH